MRVYLYGVDACVRAHVHVSGVNVYVCTSVEARGSSRQGVSSIAHDHIWGTGSLTDLVSLAGIWFPESLSGSQCWDHGTTPGFMLSFICGCCRFKLISSNSHDKPKPFTD